MPFFGASKSKTPATPARSTPGSPVTPAADTNSDGNSSTVDKTEQAKLDQATLDKTRLNMAAEDKDALAAAVPSLEGKAPFALAEASVVGAALRNPQENKTPVQLVSQVALALSSGRTRDMKTRLRRSSSLPTMTAFEVPRYVLGKEDKPRPKSKLVGVPASLADMTPAAAVRDSDSGIELVVKAGCLSDRDFMDLKMIVGEDVRATALQPCGDNAMGTGSTEKQAAMGARIMRETLPALQVYGVENFSRRPRHIHLLLTYIRALEEKTDDHVVQDAALLTECRRLCHELRNQCIYWQDRVGFTEKYYGAQQARALKSQAANHAVICRDKNNHIQRLERQSASSEDGARRAEAASGLLEARLSDSRLPEPWDLMVFLKKHAHLRGNWERFHALLEHYRYGSAPDSEWISRVDVDDMRAMDYVAPPYPSRAERDSKEETTSKPNAQDTKVSSTSEEKPVPAAVNPPISNLAPTLLEIPPARSSSTTWLELSPGSHPAVAKRDMKKPNRKKWSHEEMEAEDVVGLITPGATPTPPPPSPQLPPRGYVGSTRGTRTRTAPHTVNLVRIRASLPPGVPLDEVRPDMLELMGFGASSNEALALVQQDTALHTQFRRKELMPMLESMAYWHRMDTTDWVRNVPAQLLDLAIDNLKGRREAPPKSPPLPKVPSPPGSLSSLPGQRKDDDDFGSDFSSVSSHGDTGDEDFLRDVNAKKPKSPSQAGSSTKRSKKSGESQSHAVVTRVLASRHRLTKKSLKDLTDEELNMIEVPQGNDRSWMHFGIRVQYQAKEGGATQTSGFPRYAPVKTHTDTLKGRWRLEAHVVVYNARPWEAMFEGWVKVFYFHVVGDMTPELVRAIARYISFMQDAALSFCGSVAIG